MVTAPLSRSGMLDEEIGHMNERDEIKGSRPFTTRFAVIRTLLPLDTKTMYCWQIGAQLCDLCVTPPGHLSQRRTPTNTDAFLTLQVRLMTLPFGRYYNLLTYCISTQPCRSFGRREWSTGCPRRLRHHVHLHLKRYHRLHNVFHAPYDVPNVIRIK